MFRNDIMKNGRLNPRFVLSAAVLAGAIGLFAWQNHNTNEILKTQPEPIIPEYGVVRFVDELPEGYQLPAGFDVEDVERSDAWYNTESVIDAYSNSFDDEIRMRTDFRRSFTALQGNGSESDIDLGLRLEGCLGEEDASDMLGCVQDTWDNQ